MSDLTKIDVEDLPSVLTVREVAAVLRLPRSRAYQLIQEGQIPCVRFGRSIRVPRQVLVDLLAGASERPEQ